ncbi:MAG: glycoside hydrolase family 28 protein [Ignavibacteria bacterium]|nr:glycoside hydrolase family 28 protein [Ignavibacteria bacterium]
MKLKLSFILIVLIMVTVFTSEGLSQKHDLSITSFGAKADGETNNAAAIQSAIDKANANGGGRVIIPAGNFASGSIKLKSNVELHLELGARLLGSTKLKDYGDPDAEGHALVAAINQKNISITGKGVIDGQAPELIKDLFLMLQAGEISDKQWLYKRPTEYCRPKLVELVGCKDVKVTNVKLINSAEWVFNLLRCENVVIDRIHVESTAYWNNDGIDISDSKNVKVTNCFVNAADDGICLKSERAGDMCENIYIADCTIRSSASAFKIGTASHGGFKNIIVRNLTIYDTYRSAIAIESVDGGQLENIDIQNVTAKNTGNAIFLRLGHRNKTKPIGTLKGIRIADLKAEVPLRKPDLGYPFEGPPDYLRFRYNTSSKNRPDLGYPFIGQPTFPYNLIPSSIVGVPGGYIEDVTLENIEIVFEGHGNKDVAFIELDSLHKVPEKISDYPEFSMFGELPAWGIYVRHAKDLKFKNVKLSYKEFDFRPALVFDDAKNIEMNDVQIKSGEEMPIILFNNVEKTTLKNLQLPVDEKKGIRIQ